MGFVMGGGNDLDDSALVDDQKNKKVLPGGSNGLGLKSILANQGVAATA
jgi:hypothetical protein